MQYIVSKPCSKMKFHSYPPSKPLEQVISHFWTLQSDEGQEGGSHFRLVPDGYVDWIFHLKTPWSIRIANPKGEFRSSQSHLFSHIKQYVEVRLPLEEMFFLGVKFQPWAAQQIWNLQMTEMTNSLPGFEQLVDPFFRHLEEKLNLEKGIARQIQIIETAITSRLKNYKQNNLTGVIKHINNNIYQTRLPSFSNSQRRLEQLFKEEIGISPKLFHRTLRINKAIDKMIKSPKPHLTSICYEMGYFDQSHFISDFKKFTGLSPSKFLMQINPDGDIFNLRMDRISA